MKKIVLAIVVSAFMCSSASAGVCRGYGPQTPRDLTRKKGENKVIFNFAPSYKRLNLCNIHFHKNAEHKASGFSLSAGEGEFGGWRCNNANTLTPKQLQPMDHNFCRDVSPGDTIEVHWVYSSCNVKPSSKKFPAGCVSSACANPQLRAETKVFLLVNDRKALNFNQFAEGKKVDGYYQAKSLPNRDDALEFLGSTTGTDFSEACSCSPYQVTWNVSQSCALLDINSLSQWCEHNKFEQNHAHGVRPLVKDPRLLSLIR